ncbi:MAG: prepilin-type N-terminal cleavage/methylation domain-containing protein [Campylobacteraceae bacterium]|nr:prepilin-type N-terminal cleavage/methylation domain-containing protein [Campylobacteraceae bacterium]
MEKLHWMKQSVSDYKMFCTATCNLRRKAFTLIEVMVAVMIISVVIMALLQINANNTHIFSQVKNQETATQYLSLLVGTKYGFENEKISLEELVSDFDLDDDFRRELKHTDIEIVYQTLQSIDTGMFDESANEEEDSDPNKKKSSGTVYETGRSTLKTKRYASSLLRLRIR